MSALGLDGDEVSRDTFPLPKLGPKLEQLSNDVYKGRGFTLIRGINPNDFSPEDLTMAYLGVQAYMADLRGRQDSRGNMLGKKQPLMHDSTGLLIALT